MEIFETKTAIYRIIADNILLATMKENAALDLVAVKENHEITMRITNGERYVSLVDARKHLTITDEAKKYAAQPYIYETVIAQAVVITSLAAKLITNFILNFTRQNKDVEMKFFNDYDEALTWLKAKLLEEQAADAMAKFKDKLKK